MKAILFKVVKWFNALTIALILQCPVVAGKEPEQLVSLRKSYTEAHRQALESLNQKYSQALADLKKEFSQAGNLEGAIIVESEERGKNTTAEKDQPRKLIALKRIYKTTKDKKSAEVTAKYVKALNGLKTKLTKSGDLDGALKVREEYQKYATSPEKEKNRPQGKVAKLTKKQFKALITSGDWEWRSSHRFSGEPDLDNVKFYEDGRSNIEWIWKWEIVGATSLKVTFHGKNWDYYIFDMDFDKKRGLSNTEKSTFRAEGKQRASLILKKR